MNARIDGQANIRRHVLHAFLIAPGTCILHSRPRHRGRDDGKAGHSQALRMTWPAGAKCRADEAHGSTPLCRSPGPASKPGVGGRRNPTIISRLRMHHRGRPWLLTIAVHRYFRRCPNSGRSILRFQARATRNVPLAVSGVSVTADPKLGVCSTPRLFHDRLLGRAMLASHRAIAQSRSYSIFATATTISAL